MASAAYRTIAGESVQAVRLAGLMGLPNAKRTSDLMLNDAIADGLPSRSVDAMRALLVRIGEDAIWRLVSESTYRRAKKSPSKRISTEKSEKLYDMARVLDTAIRVFGNSEEHVAEFMRTRNMALGGRRPLDLAIESRAGADAVIKTLLEAQAGVAI